MRIFNHFVMAACAVFCLSATLSATDAVIHGVVTDAAGKPVRGAIVKAAAGEVSVSRYSHSDGRYEISVPAGNYDLAIEAYGFSPKRQKLDTGQTVDTNFSMSPRLDLTRLSAADIDALLPDNAQTRMIRAACISCHSFDRIMNRRGSTSVQWQEFLPNMTGDRRMFQPKYSPVELSKLGAELEKYFGPD